MQFKDKIEAGFFGYDGNSFAGLRFGHGIQVGSMFWLVSAGFAEHIVENPQNPDIPALFLVHVNVPRQ